MQQDLKRREQDRVHGDVARLGQRAQALRELLVERDGFGGATTTVHSDPEVICGQVKRWDVARKSCAPVFPARVRLWSRQPLRLVPHEVGVACAQRLQRRWRPCGFFPIERRHL